MTTRQTLLNLAARVEGLAANNDVRPLNREVALSMGWHRYSPSEIRKSNPGWIAPEDWIGEHVGKDGRRSPILDSLHGTEIWREPRNYLGSLDAAMTLVPEGGRWFKCGTNHPQTRAAETRFVVTGPQDGEGRFHALGECVTDETVSGDCRALTAASLRARAAMMESGE